MVADSVVTPSASAGLAPSSILPFKGLPAQVLADLRTDHAGEIGAVCISQGVLRFARDPALRAKAFRRCELGTSHVSA